MHFFGHKKPVSNCVMSRLSGNKIPSFILKQKYFFWVGSIGFSSNLYTRKKTKIDKKQQKKTHIYFGIYPNREIRYKKRIGTN